MTIQQTLFAFVMLVAYVFPSIGYAEGTAVFLAKCNAPAADLVATSGLDLTDLTQGDPFYYTSDIEPRPTTTHSDIPHLPVYSGHMSTNDTYQL